MSPLKLSSGGTITDMDQRIKRWVDHYPEVYYREGVTASAIEVIESLPTMTDLNVEPSAVKLQ